MDKKHRILIIGTGSIGERHVRCFLATDRAEVGVCELNDARRDEVAGRYALVEATGDLDAALARPWDAVLVASPAHTHIPIARKAAEAGHHLLIEKPLSTSLDGLDALRDTVAAKGLVAAVSYHFHAHPGIRAMKAALDSGRFGKPLQVYGMVAQYFPHYRPAYRDVYFAHLEQGGGAIQDSMTHLLNLGEGLVGPITRLAADAAHQQLAGVTVEDTVHVIARHGEVLGNYSLNMYQHPNESYITVVCEAATVRFELHKHRWRVMTAPEGPWEEHAHPLPDRDAWYVANAQHFLDVLEGKAAPLCSLDAGVQTLRVNLAVLESARMQMWRDVT